MGHAGCVVRCFNLRNCGRVRELIRMRHRIRRRAFLERLVGFDPHRQQQRLGGERLVAKLREKKTHDPLRHSGQILTHANHRHGDEVLHLDVVDAADDQSFVGGIEAPR